MHLADGILDQPALLLGANALGIGAVAWAIRSTTRLHHERARFEAGGPARSAWAGTLAAFVLAAQAINVPMVPGATAHALGTGLVAFCLSPPLAILTLFGVLLIQALLFADGGVTVLFINTVTIAVIPVATVTLCRRWLGARHLQLSAWLGTALGNTLGALTLASLLTLGAGAPPAWTFTWLVGVQGLAAVVEGGLTVSAVRYLGRRAPHYLYGIDRPPDDGLPRSGVPWRALLAAAVVALLIPFASSAPDALEVVVARLGGR